MKKRLIALTMTSALAATLLAGAQVGVNAETPAASYLLAYKGNSLPANYQDAILQAGGVVVRAIPEVGIVEVESAQPGFLSTIRSHKDIQAADLEMEMYLETEPAAADGQKVTLTEQNGNYHHLQWDIKKVTNNFQSFDLNKGNHDTVVAVIDSGFDFSHPDLAANVDLAGSKTFVPGTTDAWDGNGHGTHVAGAIAANGKVVGVGPNLKLRAYRVFGATGGAQQSWITDAIVAAANDGVDVINMSIGGWRWMAHNLGEQGDSASMVAYHRALHYATQKGALVVVSAGNDSRNLNSLHDMQTYWMERYGLDIKGPSRVVPAQIPGVVTVSSSNSWSDNSIAFYSNYGNWIDVAGPGGDNGPLYDTLTRQDPAGNYLDKRDFTYRSLSTYPTYFAMSKNATAHSIGYSYLHGTSMAAPKVAGIAGVIKAAHPEYTPAQLAAALRNTAVDFGKVGQDPLFGSGEANVYNALTQLKK